MLNIVIRSLKLGGKPVQSILTKSAKGFDMSEFLPGLAALDQPLRNLREIDSDTASVKISDDIRLVLDGSFDSKLTTGKIDRVTVYQGNKEILEITESGVGLDAFLALGAEAGGGGALMLFSRSRFT